MTLEVLRRLILHQHLLSHLLCGPCDYMVLGFGDLDILKKQQNGVDSATVFCDCSAAFNTIDHDMLMKKLRLYGVKSDNTRWFKSYFQGQTQYVSIGGIPSNILPVFWGVVQGSFLGPIIFLLVINDIVVIGDINRIVVIYIYADDMCICLSLTGNKAYDQTKIDYVMELVTSYIQIQF